jgi:hypothetical protein
MRVKTPTKNQALKYLFLSQDPWERELVEVRDSLLEQAGQGLFAR